MRQSNGHWIVEEDEEVYGEYLDMVGKRSDKKRIHHLVKERLI